MAYKLGLDCKLYRCVTEIDDEANTPALADWDEVDNIIDATTNLTKDEADITTRANAGWRARVGTLKDGGVDIEMLWDTDDEAFAAMLTAYLDNSLIALAIMDGDIDVTGSEGLTANFSVMDVTRGEQLAEGVKATVKAVPSTVIAWYEVTGS